MITNKPKNLRLKIIKEENTIDSYYAIIEYELWSHMSNKYYTVEKEIYPNIYKYNPDTGTYKEALKKGEIELEKLKEKS